MHFYPFNIGDYATATAHLEPLEDIAYRRLMDLYYSTEKPIPECLNKTSRLIRMRLHSDCIAIVLDEFFTLEDDGYHCDRIDVELFKFHEKSEKASKSAKSRWKKAKQKQKVKVSCERIANAEETHSEGNAKQEPITKKQEPLTSNHKPVKKNIAQALDYSLWESKPSEDVLTEWLSHRKKKKLSISQLVITKTGKEINAALKLGYSADDCLSEAIVRGWQGVKADWMSNSGAKKTAMNQGINQIGTDFKKPEGW